MVTRNQNQNQNQNPFFFIYLFYLWVISKLWSQIKEVKAEPVITLQERTQEYITNKRAVFLKHVTNKETILQLSSTIEPEFYEPKKLQVLMREVDNVLEPAWQSRKLMEATPQGTIMMHYDAYKQGFSYYSDIKGISYSLLNAVAMKYVILFRCLHFFVDTEVTTEEHKSPFAEEVATAKPSSKTCRKVNKRIEELDKEFSRNRFIHLGRLSNCSILQRPEKKNVLNHFSSNYTRDLLQETSLQNEVMSYSDFKRKQKQQC